MPKYLDFKLWFTLDTRDGIIFYLKTRQSGKDKSFRIETKDDLDKFYKWLDKKDIEWGVRMSKICGYSCEHNKSGVCCGILQKYKSIIGDIYENEAD